MYSRRDFGKIAMAGVPLAAAWAKINSKVNGVQIGVQTYSFRDFPAPALDAIIKAMTEIGLGQCEVFAAHVEPAGGPRGGAEAKMRPQNADARKEAREELRKWRLSVSMDHFKGVRKKFDDAGIEIYAYNYSFNDGFTDDEIDRGFEMTKALGAKVITASSTLSVAKRVAPFAEKHKMIVAMHGHSNLTDPNQFATPKSFTDAMAMSKYFWVNLDIGHFSAAGFVPVEFIQSHHDRITNLHLKDRKKGADGANVPWGEGDTPIKPVLLLLKEKKYPIPAFIEYEYRGTADPTSEVKKCFEYCKRALA